jgi:glycosyltransferase involved in cell wall biosynthesis
MATVSVIIVNYNNEKFLRKCIESVLNQTKIPDEIIISDDCSTDNSLNIIHEYEKSYSNVFLIKNEINIGVTRNRDKAIRAATSTYITTLDSDDYYFPKKIEKEFNILANNPNVIAFSDVVDIDVEGEIILNRKTKFIEGNNCLKRLDAYFVGKKEIRTRDIMYAKSAYLAVGGFDFSYQIYEDLELYLRLEKVVSHWIHSGEIGTAYRQIPTGLSKTKSKIFEFKLKLYLLIKSYSLSRNKVAYFYIFIKFLIKKTIIFSINKLFKK